MTPFEEKVIDYLQRIVAAMEVEVKAPPSDTPPEEPKKEIEYKGLKLYWESPPRADINLNRTMVYLLFSRCPEKPTDADWQYVETCVMYSRRKNDKPGKRVTVVARLFKQDSDGGDPAALHTEHLCQIYE